MRNVGRGIHLALALAPHVGHAIPAAWQGCVEYLKDLFVEGNIYSVASIMFRFALEKDVDVTVADTVLKTLASDSLEDLSQGQASRELIAGSTFFSVTNARPERRTLVQPQHLVAERWTMRVSLCTVLSQRDEEVIVHQHELKPRTFDLRAFVQRLREFLAGARAWKGVQSKSALKERTLVSEDERWQLSLPVPEMSWSTSSSSHAIVPLPAAPEADLDGRDVSASILSLTQILKSSQGAPGQSVLLSSVPPSMVEGVQGVVDSSVALVRSGGEHAVALNMQAVDWTTIMRLRDPVGLLVGPSRPLKPAKQQKPMLFFQLRLQGWVHVDQCLNNGWVAGAPLEFSMSLSRPRSYFLALLSHQAIIDKGVTEIAHKQKDGYYQCLLSLNGPDLLQILDQAALEECSDHWFKQNLKAVEDDTDSDASVLAVGDGHVNVAHVLDRRLPSILPVGVVPDCWVRCIMRRPGQQGTKLYFDGFSDPSRRQRGFVFCRSHECRRYRYCDSFASRVMMAADMLLWWEARLRPECNTHARHLAWDPAPAAVVALAGALELEDF